MTEEAAEVVAIDDEVVEETRNLPAVRASDAIVARGEVTVPEVLEQRDKVKAVMEAVMKPGVHYGIVPGVSKPTLYKPGAEILCTTFRFAPSYERQLIWDQGHLTVISECTLTHAQSGTVLGAAGGLCTTREAKYAYRKKGRVCPSCGAEAIIKGKASYGGGWVCWKNHKTTPGCGEKFEDGDNSIESQVEGRVDNEDVPDAYNTVLKMADKRALVSTVLIVTGASDIFTQDVEDAGMRAADTTEVAAEGSAAGSALRKMRLDIEDLFRTCDKKRKVEGGTTFAEFEKVVKAEHGNDVDWTSLDEELTAALGMKLGTYYAYLTQTFPQGVVPREFDVWSAQDDVPF